MLRLKRRAAKKLQAEINVVPYIDVMLVLLVIFIVTAPLLQQGVSVDLPRASAKALPPAAKEPVVVSVDKAGLLYLNVSDSPHQAIERASLVTQVAKELKQHPERKVLVKADTQVNYGEVMAAMVLLQQAGAGSVGLVTDEDVRSKSRAKG